LRETLALSPKNYRTAVLKVIIPLACKIHQHLWGHEVGGNFCYTLDSCFLQLAPAERGLGISGKNARFWERLPLPNSHHRPFSGDFSKLSTAIGDNLALIHEFAHKSFHKAGNNIPDGLLAAADRQSV
jgi:hypothetical protein